MQVLRDAGTWSILAVVTKCTEHYGGKLAKGSKSYFANIIDGRRQSPWFSELQRLVENPNAYAFLDGAQLVKHALRLGYCFPYEAVILMYLYWDRANGGNFQSVLDHRQELIEPQNRVTGDRIGLEGMCYLDLFRHWAGSGFAWLKSHATQLMRRYCVDAE